MNDPRLNSVHLEMPRRQEFRRARDVLLGARGCQTIAGEVKDSSQRLPTAIDRVPERDADPVEVWLIDRDYIYPLHLGLNTVGRSPDNDIVLQNGFVSRRHCTILVHADSRVELHDTASKNGTYINGHKLTGPTRLNAGDEIRMCDMQLIFMTQAGEEAGGVHTATLHD